MSVMQNKEIVRRYIEEVFNKGNLTVVDEILAPTFVDHNPSPGQATGPTGAKEFARIYRTAFPNIVVHIEDMIAEGDLVGVRNTVRGTQQGMFMDVPPSGKQVSWQVMTFYRLANGKITERWSTHDNLGLLQQLGAIPERLVVSTVR